MKPTLSRTLTQMLKQRGDYDAFISELEKVITKSEAEKALQNTRQDQRPVLTETW